MMEVLLESITIPLLGAAGLILSSGAAEHHRREVRAMMVAPVRQMMTFQAKRHKAAMPLSHLCTLYNGNAHSWNI